jgi:hypothetical protein
VYQDQIPDGRWGRSRHDRTELLGDQRHGFWDQSDTGARHHEGKDRFPLRRDHGKRWLTAQRFKLLIEQPPPRQGRRCPVTRRRT